MLNFSIITANGKSCVTLFVPGADEPILTADDSHPGFTDIVASLLDPNGATAEDLVPLFEPERAAIANFARTSVSERISVKDGQVFFDQVPVDSALTRQMLRLMDEGESDWEGLARFMEKVETNPNEHSRTQLYEWLRRHDLAINSEGDCIFYKGVEARGDGSYVSVHSGPAIVNGQEVNGQVPNNPGDVVEMDRSQVQHDPARGCASGLHVANWRYAESWARGAVLKVLVNPRDVVSVPTHCDWEKVRCSRYKVLEVVDAPVNTAYLPMDGIDTPDLVGDPADFDLDVSGGDGAAAAARMGMSPTPVADSLQRHADAVAKPSTAPIQAGDRVVVKDSYGCSPKGYYRDKVGTVETDDTWPSMAYVVFDEPHAGPLAGNRAYIPTKHLERVSQPVSQASARKHGKGGTTSNAAKGSGRNPAQDDKGRFSAGRPGSQRDASGRFAG